MKIPGTALILIIYMSSEQVGNISVKCYTLYSESPPIQTLERVLQCSYPIADVHITDGSHKNNLGFRLSNKYL